MAVVREREASAGLRGNPPLDGPRIEVAEIDEGRLVRSGNRIVGADCLKRRGDACNARTLVEHPLVSDDDDSRGGADLVDT